MQEPHQQLSAEGFEDVGLKEEQPKGEVIHIVSTIKIVFSIVSQTMQGSSLGFSFLVQGTRTPELGKIMWCVLCLSQWKWQELKDSCLPYYGWLIFIMFGNVCSF